MHKWVHVVWNIAFENGHTVIGTFWSTIGSEHLPSRVIVDRIRRVQAVQGAGSDKDSSICKSLCGSVPAFGLHLVARFSPAPPVKSTVGRGPTEVSNTVESISD